MKKFFLFKRRELNASSTLTSDTGEGLDLFAVPADRIGFISASLGKVSIVFNDATIYEESNLLDGESFRKTSVTVSCEEGKEEAVMGDIMSFVYSSGSKQNVMRFDAVGSSNVKNVKLESVSDMTSEIRELPIVRSTGDSSRNTFIGGTAGTAFGTGNIIAGIDFGADNKPIIDLNETGLGESGGNVNAWTNSGSGGSTYDVSAINGTLNYDDSTGRANNGLATAAADFASSNNVQLANNYVRSGAFTMFAVIGKSTSDIDDNPKFGPLVQGSATSGQGLTFAFTDPFNNGAYVLKLANERGESVIAGTTNSIVDSHLPTEIRRTAYVFVVRRDRDNNLFFYTNDGTLDAFVNANTEGSNARTDGNLVIKYLGNSGLSGSELKFIGNVPRFGVIERDIGASAASSLAKALANRYTP